MRPRTIALLLVMAVGLTLLTLGIRDSRSPGGSFLIVRAAPAPSGLVPAPSTSASPLSTAVQAAASAAGARVAVEVIDLSGAAPARFSYAADDGFTAASTYKLPALMAEAERVSTGAARPAEQVCFSSSQAEDGWFDDYGDGTCLSLQEVATRAGRYSDNTAGHMLVDHLGGTAALNSYAQARGARESAFFEPNQTTAADLAALWASEAEGRAGGAGAQQWLYPILTHTEYEDGIPAGVPGTATVVHKVGAIDETVNDAGLVSAGSTRYAVAIMTDGAGGDAGWALVARISALIWRQETGTLGR